MRYCYENEVQSSVYRLPTQYGSWTMKCGTSKTYNILNTHKLDSMETQEMITVNKRTLHAHVCKLIAVAMVTGTMEYTLSANKHQACPWWPAIFIKWQCCTCVQGEVDWPHIYGQHPYTTYKILQMTYFNASYSGVVTMATNLTYKRVFNNTQWHA